MDFFIKDYFRQFFYISSKLICVKWLLPFFLITFLPVICFPQDKRINSILNLLKTSKADTNKVRKISELFNFLTKADVTPEISSYASEALSISQKTNYKWGTGISWYMISFCERSKREYEQALIDDSTAEKILEEAGDKKNVGRSLFLRGHILADTGNYPGAIRYYNDALETWDKIGDKEFAGAGYNDLGSVYSFMGDRSKAVEYIYQAM